MSLEIGVCDRCGKRPIAPASSEAWQYDWCQVCYDNQAEEASERATERFYGSGEPVTMDEIHQAAWREKQGLR